MNKNDTVAIIRSLLSSSKCACSILNLNSDFKNETGINIPLFGYANLSDFLHSIPDTVKLTGTYPTEQVSLVTSEKSAHIVSLVKRQRSDGKKRTHIRSRKFEARAIGFKKCNTLKKNAVENFEEKADDSHGENASRVYQNNIPTNMNLTISSNSLDGIIKDCAGIGESIPHIDPRLHAQVGAYVEVHPCQIFNPHKFYFRFRKLKKVFSNFMDKLQVFYTNHNVPTLRKDIIRPKLICVVRYEMHTEPMWHRAEIQKVLSNSQVIVNFIDNGNDVKIWKKDLKYLHRDFMSLPRQAFLGSLANIRPSGGESNWSSGANERFVELSFGKDLVAGVVHVDLKGFCMKMALSCTKDLEIHINDTLVKEGFAEFDTSLLDSNFMFYKESKSWKMSTVNPNHKSEFLTEKIHHSDQYTEAILKSLEYNFPKKFQSPVFYFSNSYGNNNRLKKMFSVEK